jgi:hypothetical protein
MFQIRTLPAGEVGCYGAVFMPDRPAHASSLRPSAPRTALTSLAAMVQERLRLDPFGGAAFVIPAWGAPTG